MNTLSVKTIIVFLVAAMVSFLIFEFSLPFLPWVFIIVILLSAAGYLAGNEERRAKKSSKEKQL